MAIKNLNNWNTNCLEETCEHRREQTLDALTNRIDYINKQKHVWTFRHKNKISVYLQTFFSFSELEL